MPVGLVVKVPDGLVLAADSRTVVVPVNEQGVAQTQGNYDNVTTNIFSFKSPHNFVGVLACSVSVLGRQTISACITEFKESLKKTQPERISIVDFAAELSDFLISKWDTLQTPPLGIQLPFLVAGYDAEQASGRIYAFSIPENPEPAKVAEYEFGIFPQGESRVIARILLGYDHSLEETINQNLNDEERRGLRFPLFYDLLSLRAAVKLANVLIRTTIDLQSLAIMPHTTGDPIDICTITSADRLTYV